MSDDTRSSADQPNLYPNLKSFTKGDPRVLAHNKKQKERAARHKSYKQKLSQFKEDQMDLATEMMESDDLPQPVQMLAQMLKLQAITMADKTLSPALANKEKALYLDMYKQFVNLTGANAPTTTTIDMTVEQEEKLSPEDLQQALLDLTNSAKLIEGTVNE